MGLGGTGALAPGPCFSDANLLSASAFAEAHASISSRKMSHTQLTHPLMQQLSGSSGFGGTTTPATTLLFARICANRSARSVGPRRREPKTTFALSAPLGSVGGGVGAGGDVPVYYDRQVSGVGRV